MNMLFGETACTRALGQLQDDPVAAPRVRVALVRFWSQHQLLRVPFPLIGAASLRGEGSWAFSEWLFTFLEALADERSTGCNC